MTDATEHWATSAVSIDAHCSETHLSLGLAKKTQLAGFLKLEFDLLFGIHFSPVNLYAALNSNAYGRKLYVCLTGDARDRETIVSEQYRAGSKTLGDFFDDFERFEVLVENPQATFEELRLTTPGIILETVLRQLKQARVKQVAPAAASR